MILLLENIKTMSKPAKELRGKILKAVDHCIEINSSDGDIFTFKKGDDLHVVHTGVDPDDVSKTETKVIYRVNSNNDFEYMYITHFTQFIDGDYHCDC